MRNHSTKRSLGRHPAVLAGRTPISESLAIATWFFALALFTPALCADEASGKADNVAASPQALAFFEKSVRPILVEHCYECHAGEERNGGLLLDSRDGILQGGDSGTSAVPGDVGKSLIIEAIRYKNLDLQMPPQNRLADGQIQVLEKWVAMGLPDPREKTATGIPPVGMSIDDGRKFWSFRPVSDPPEPHVKNASWVGGSIDAFILQKLEEHKLEPAPPTGKRALLRRVTLNLTGIPPTVEETDAFLADTSEEAYNNVVDRLLASPQYGVRWGRHWLDVARYADSNGLDENLAYGNAWRYRDYVVDAFNNDKPFDRFLIEQLAGDLLPSASQETRIATGFLSLGAKVLAEPDMEKLVMDTVDEQLDATGKAFLGMTFGCVRCHDHKFDPVKQTDYYALAAIMKSTRTFADTNTGAIKHWHEHTFATEEQKKEIAEIDAAIKKKKSAASAFKSAAITRIRTEARAKAADYLKAAVLLPAMTTLSEVQIVAAKAGLHPRILHHCRTHLEYHKYDGVFEAWHTLKSKGPDAVFAHYSRLFSDADADADAAAPSAKGTDAAVTVADSPQLAAARAAVDDLAGFLAVPPKVDYAFDEKTLIEYYRLEEEARKFESRADDLPSAMGVSDQTILTSLPIHVRGSHMNLGKPVAREFPEVMRSGEVRPIFPDKQSGRLELAHWMASSRHPLTARVFVNRVWGWHFGRAIVSSTENFGKLGARPTHPELLDWLARKFMESGWKVKELHRRILLSNTYKMAVTSENEAAGEEADPENNLLWKFRLQRLDAEQLRDSLLAVSKRLDITLGGKTVPLRNRQFVFNHTSQDHTKYDSVRRSIYLPVIRNNVYTLFEQFDFPDPTMPTGQRNTTVIAPQALLMMNSDEVVDSAAALATQILEQNVDIDQRCDFAYQTVLGRSPESLELQRAVTFVQDIQASSVSATGLSSEDEARAWAMLCQSLMASNEFIYVR